MAVLSCFLGHLLPTGTSGPLDNEKACWVLGQTLPLVGAGGVWASWALESEIKAIDRQAGRQAGATERARKMYVSQLDGCSLSWKLRKEILGEDIKN